jgi:hypothetical protein
MRFEAAQVLCFALLVLAAVGSGVQGQTLYGRREFTQDDHVVKVDERKATFRIDVPEEREYGDREGPSDPTLYKTLGDAFAANPHAFVSVSVTEAMAKRFDDHLYATIELLLERGHEGAFPPKNRVLERFLERIGGGAEDARSEARARIHAALALAGAKPAIPEAEKTRVRTLVEAFDADRLRSKPLGFYTWTPELSAIFRRDRFLQEVLDVKQDGAWLVEAAKALGEDEALSKDYDRLLAVAGHLTNPLAVPSLLGLTAGSGARAAFLPASRSLEGELFKRLYGDRPIQMNRELMSDFIEGIRSGKVNLAPTKASGWYDHQTYALEPLILPAAAPESRKISRSPAYAKLCEDVFKAMLTKRRETHVKQLEIPRVGAAAPIRDEVVVVTVTPSMHAEPQVTYLRRTADAYRFVREALSATLGEGALGTPMYGLEEEAISDALTRVERRFRSLAALLCSELGLDPGIAGDGLDEDAVLALGARAAKALDDKSTVAEFSYDPRMMVPVAFDLTTQKVRCWAVLGVAVRKVEISYKTMPAVAVETKDGRSVDPKNLRIRSGTFWGSLPYEVWIECSVKEPLNREEFRALCDREKTPSAIKRALAAM